MFDYSRIDRIDPDFLEQFLVQGEKRDAAFRCPQKLSRKIMLDGVEYGVSVEYESDHTLAILWNEYAYDLTAKWGDVKRNYRAKLTQPSTGGRNRVLSDFVPGINDGGAKPAPCPEGLRILREETRCYSVHELMAKGGEKDGEAAVQAGVSELTHEQVRRRVLCFVAMMARVVEEDALEEIVRNIVIPRAGSQGRIWKIAHLDLWNYDDYSGSLSIQIYATEKGATISVGYGRFEQFGSELSQKVDLFAFPEGEGSGENPPKLSYAKKGEAAEKEKKKAAARNAKKAAAPMLATEPWCMLPVQKKHIPAEVTWLGETKKYVYSSPYNASSGDRAVIGYPHKADKLFPGDTFGRPGTVVKCQETLPLRPGHAVDLEYVFTTNPSQSDINMLAKRMDAPLNWMTMLAKSTGYPNADPEQNETLMGIEYMTRGMTRRLLAAVSVLAHPKLASAKAQERARELLRAMPLREGEEEVFQRESVYKGGYGFDWFPGSMPDEPELTRRRAELLKCAAMYVQLSGCINYDEWIVKRMPEVLKRPEKWSYADFERIEFGAPRYWWGGCVLDVACSCFESAAIFPYYTVPQCASKEEIALLCDYLNQCAMMDAIGVMMKNGLVNLLQTYLLAHPPIFECVEALVNYARGRGMEWAAELLEAYRCGDMDAIRQCALKNVAPVELEFKLPRKPEDFEDAFREKEMSDENRRWLCFDIEMQWAERSGCGDAQRIAWKTEAEKARDELAAALIDDLPEALDGKRFELMGFDDDLVKVITQRIEACGGTVQKAAEGSDYAVLYGAGLGSAPEKLADAICAAKKGVRLVSDRILWRALRGVKLENK